MTKRCCGSSVGILIEDQDKRLLMVTRGWWPLGTAPVAGHVYDAHSDPGAALTEEVQEEVGLTVTGTPTLLWEGHRPNLCASLPAQPRPGHYWWLYRATATGTLRPAEGETQGAAWYALEDVHAMAKRTIDHAVAGHSADSLPTDAMEAVWVSHLDATGHITANSTDLDAVARLYTTPPPNYWRGGRP